MKNIIFIFLFAYFNCQGQAERHLKQYFPRAGYDEINELLNNVSVNLTKEEQQKCFNNFLKFDRFNPRRSEGFFGDTLGIHYVNLNNDEFTDIIYINDYGILCTSIFYGTKDSVVLMIAPSGQNHLKALKFKDNKCIEAIFEFTPYLDSDHGEMVYSLKKNKSRFKYERYNRDCTKEPQQYFTKNLKIRTKINAKLRENPRTDKGLCYPEVEEKFYNDTSNIFCIFDKKIKGIAWAEQKDSLGRTFFLIEIKRQKNYDLIEGEKPKYLKNEFNIGWILSEDIDIIDNRKKGIELKR